MTSPTVAVDTFTSEAAAGFGNFTRTPEVDASAIAQLKVGNGLSGMSLTSKTGFNPAGPANV